jgi:hypothetical protein
MASKIPLKTTSWRISPEEYLGLLHEADAQLSSVRDAYRDGQLGSYRRGIESAQGSQSAVERAQSYLLAAEERVADEFRPRWFLVTKRERRDTPSGSIDEVVPTIEVPRRYNFASATLRGGEHSIDVTLSSAGPSITLTGIDESWLRQAELWANASLRKYRSPWWWLHSVRGIVFQVLLVAGVYFALDNLLPLIGVSDAAATLVALAAEWGVVVAIFVLVTRFRAAITEPGSTRAKAFFTQAGLLLAGGVMGAIISRLGDTLFPA